MSTSDQSVGSAPAPTNNTEEGNPPSRLSALLSFTQGIIPLLVALFILWYFGTALKRMFGLTSPSVTEVEWGRNVFLYGGLEALAFAAAGFLFGREVNRQRAETAERRADSAQRSADAARNSAAISAANGRALAEGVRALDDAGGGALSPARENMPLAAARATEFNALRRMADSLFPAG